MTTPGSGNRWEPAADESRPPEEPTAPAGAGARRWSRWAARVPRPRLWLVGLAVACLLLGGVAGFLVGHATAGHGTEVGRFSQLDHHGRSPDFGRDGFGDGGSGHDGSGHGGSRHDGGPR